MKKGNACACDVGEQAESSAWKSRLFAAGSMLRAAQQHEAIYRQATPCVGLPAMPMLYFSAQQLDEEYRSSATTVPRSAGPWRRQHAQHTAIEIASTHNRILNDAGDQLAEAINAFCRQFAERHATRAAEVA